MIASGGGNQFDGHQKTNGKASRDGSPQTFSSDISDDTVSFTLSKLRAVTGELRNRQPHPIFRPFMRLQHAIERVAWVLRNTYSPTSLFS